MGLLIFIACFKRIDQPVFVLNSSKYQILFAFICLPFFILTFLMLFSCPRGTILLCTLAFELTK